MHVKMTVNQKLILVYLLIFTIPSILFSMFFFNNIKNQEESLYLDAAAQDTRQVFENVGEYVDLVHNIEWYIQNDYGLMDFIALRDPKTTAEYVDFNRSIIKSIERMMEMNQDLYQVRIFAENNDLLEIWPHLYRRSTLDSTGQQGRISVSDPDIYWRLNHQEERLAYNQEPSIDVVSYYKSCIIRRAPSWEHWKSPSTPADSGRASSCRRVQPCISRKTQKIYGPMPRAAPCRS